MTFKPYIAIKIKKGGNIFQNKDEEKWYITCTTKRISKQVVIASTSITQTKSKHISTSFLLLLRK